MRTIKFRGKKLCQDEWIYGSLITRGEQGADGNFIDTGRGECYPLQQDTIGQFTGLSDKNGKDIYEGDIVRMNTITGGVYQIAFEESHIGAFSLCSKNGFVGIFGRDADFEPFYCEVIGNIHDNPELLEGK